MNITEYQNYHEVKEHTSLDFPYNTYLCSIPLDFASVPLHWHDEIELISIKKGHGAISVDFQTHLLSAGDIIFILPGQLHTIQQHEDSVMEYENIIFKKELLFSGKYDLCADAFITPLLHNPQRGITFITPTTHGYSQFSNLISQIDGLSAARPEGYQLAIKGCLFQFFFQLIVTKKKSDSICSIKTKSLEKLKTILKYVEIHYNEPITVDKMAALSFYSKSHFMKFFKTHIGTGFIEYLNDYRMTMAARLLITNDISVLETAVQTGFDNLSYFHRLFKRKYGQTPQKYRKSTPI